MGRFSITLRRPSPAERRAEPAPLVRHVAILLATLVAYLLPTAESAASRFLLVILGGAALLNFAVFWMSLRPRLFFASHFLSPLVGVSSWTAIVHVTGGSGSPYLAGLGLEIILSALTLGPLGTGLVSASSAAALWIQQVPLGFDGRRVMELGLESAFLLAIGGVADFVRRRWGRANDELLDEAARARERLRVLEEELEGLRALGQVGENTARLAHALKNAVGALRGFTRLIEARLPSSAGEEGIRDGLRSAVDRLEQISRLLLQPPGDPGPRAQEPEAREVGRTIEDAIGEASKRHPGIRWNCSAGGNLNRVSCPEATLREVLGVLLDNAAEAMAGKGEVLLAAREDGGRLEVEVRDGGCGIPPSRLDDLFRPGRTTKAEGSGFGLFLARRLVEARGGTMTVSSAAGGGASFGVILPLQDASR